MSVTFHALNNITVNVTFCPTLLPAAAAIGVPFCIVVAATGMHFYVAVVVVGMTPFDGVSAGASVRAVCVTAWFAHVSCLLIVC